MSGIFKAYDIRGVYPVDLDAAMAEAIGRAYIEFTGAKKVVVGRDMRPHSEPLFQALAKGMVAQGAEVIDIGMCSTPQSYFANGTLKADGSVMITASHNPGEWNGFKLCRRTPCRFRVRPESWISRRSSKTDPGRSAANRAASQLTTSGRSTPRSCAGLRRWTAS